METQVPEAPKNTIPGPKQVEDERKPARGITKSPHNPKKARKARKIAARSRRINRGRK